MTIHRASNEPVTTMAMAVQPAVTTVASTSRLYSMEPAPMRCGERVRYSANKIIQKIETATTSMVISGDLPGNESAPAEQTARMIDKSVAANRQVNLRRHSLAGA